MQCTAAYPTDWKDMNLNVIKTYRSLFKDFVIGISDQLKIPVRFIGVGEAMEDLQIFNKETFVETLFNN